MKGSTAYAPFVQCRRELAPTLLEALARNQNLVILYILRIGFICRSRMTHRMFVALAGGGAKALIHLGALRALEKRGVEFKGLSGTSAGALVATLKASGFTASDLLDPETGKSLIQSLRAINPKIRRARDLFGRFGWWRVRLFRSALPNIGIILFATLALCGCAILLAGWMLFLGWFLTGALILVALVLFLLVTIRTLLAGLARSKVLATALATLLQQKLFPGEPGRVVRMGDFGTNGRPTLKIVSANLSTGRMELFSPERTPDVAVAEAVAASISLPIIFEPPKIGDDLHMDGGIVSNLPAWSFDEERELDPEAITLAVEIETATERRVLNKFNWAAAFIQTGLFGSAELNLRAVGQAERLLLSTSLNLLEFDLTPQRAFKEILDAERAATTNLDKWLFRRPEMYRDACKTTKALVDDVLETVLEQRNPGVRVAIAAPDRGHTRSLRLRYSTGYDGYNDEGMLLPIDGTVVGQAWATKESWFEVSPLPAQFSLDGPEHRLRRKALRQDLKWVLCIPILSGPVDGLRFVVQIDGGKELPHGETVDSVITRIEYDVKEFFGMLADRLTEMEI